MNPDQFKQLEGIFEDGFLVMYASPDGKLQYAKWNPRRTETIEMLEKMIVDVADTRGPSFWKGFITKEEVPDYPPTDWENHNDGEPSS